MSKIASRANSEESDSLLESFSAGPMMLTLETPDDFARSYMSSRYEGEVTVGPVKFSATVARNSVVVHLFGDDDRNSYTSESLDIDEWKSGKDENDEDVKPPPYNKIKHFIAGIIARTSASLPKFAALRSVETIGGNKVKLDYGDYTNELGSMAAIGWKLVDYPEVEFGFDVLSDYVDVYTRRSHSRDLPVDISRQSPAAIIESIGKYLNKLGFPGDKRAEIDVILRDKRLNKGKRMLRYNVDDYRTALEQLKAVLEHHKVSASLQRGAPQ